MRLTIPRSTFVRSFLKQLISLSDVCFYSEAFHEITKFAKMDDEFGPKFDPPDEHFLTTKKRVMKFGIIDELETE